MILGLFVGESFAELTVVKAKGTTMLEHQRWYLPKQGLKAGLLSWLKRTNHKPDRVIVASRFLYKLSGHRLGGSVAQVVTNGFEKWGTFALPSKNLSHKNISRIPSISSQDLSFAVNEKILANGKVEKPLNLSELETIHEKLKLMEIKKICLHFVNSDANSEHQKQAKSFFTELGYEVYEPASPKNFRDIDLFTTWKTNTLNAAVSGTFEEQKKDITEALTDFISPEKIFYFDADLNINQGDSASRLSSLFALEACLHSQISKKIKSKNPISILHFGIEHFSLIQNTKSEAQSPWGPLALKTQSCIDFNIQPTSLLELNDESSLKIDTTQSYEPGPIRFGRGLKPLVADLLIPEENLSNLVGLDEKQVRMSKDRWMMSLQTWQRARKINGMTAEEFEKTLRHQVNQALNFEIHKNLQGQAVCYGFMNPLTDLKSEFTNYLSDREFSKSHLIALEAIERGL